ncbi:unnamed protein product [Ilex paraguariensis]|uniref:Uncharacterized protein n=1 Tax=Ilex paraguariensis TaxID=185542 RepID=A0ABC8RYQ6_9AQUA
MYPDIETRISIDEQLEKFKRADGLFSMSMAVLTRDKKQPGPRNLNAIKKGKAKVVEIDDDGIEVVDDEQTEEDEETEMVEVEKDDDDEDLDLGDNKD